MPLVHQKILSLRQDAQVRGLKGFWLVVLPRVVTAAEEVVAKTAVSKEVSVFYYVFD